MSDSSHDPEETLDPDADADDPNHTIAENDQGTVGAGDCPGSDEDIAEVFDTLIETLVPEHRDLTQTLPQETLRPKLFRTVSDVSSVTVQSRVIQPASESDTSKKRDGQSGIADSPDYLTLQMLGMGGMGTVHLARQVALGRDVAVKQLHHEGRQQQLAQDEFVTEAILTGKLEHPNIVPIYELGRSPDGNFFYSMKNIRGRAWSDTIAKLNLDENLDILINVCDAIAFAHAEGVIHRDLKPQNIMTGGFGEVLVLDWGLAMLIRPETEVTSFAGTPAFMAPEMVNPPFGIGPHSDIYLLGAILYMILTGKPPHGGTSGRDCLLAVAKNEIECPDENHVRKVDPSGELLSVALRAMATQPEDRYSTVKEFQQTIRDYLSHHESRELSGRAQASLESAQSTSDYVQYSRAVFGFEEAFKLWDQNVQAKEGIIAARLVWALCAEDQGDFDLSLSLLDDSVAEQQEIRIRVSTARNERDAHVARLSFLRKVAAAMLAFIVVGSCFASSWIYLENRETKVALSVAEEEKAEAIRQEGIAKQQTALAIELKAEALKQEGIAKNEKAEAVDARKDAQAALQIAKVEKQRARGEAANANALSSFLTGVLAETDPIALSGRSFGVRSTGSGRTVEHVVQIATDQVDVSFPDRDKLRATVLHTLGNVWISYGDNEAAAKMLSEALDIRQELLPPGHKDRVASVHSAGRVAFYGGRLDEARELFDEALSECRGLLEQPADPQLLREVEILLSDILWDLGVLRAGRAGGHEEWESPLTESLQLRKRLFGPQSRQVCMSLVALAQANLVIKDDKVSGLLYLQQALAILDKIQGQKLFAKAGQKLVSAQIMTTLGNFKLAESSYREGLEILEEALGGAHLGVSFVRRQLAHFLYFDKKDYPAAKETWLKVNEELQAIFGPDHQQCVEGLVFLSYAHVRLGEFDEAKSTSRRAVDICLAHEEFETKVLVNGLNGWGDAHDDHATREAEEDGIWCGPAWQEGLEVNERILEIIAQRVTESPEDAANQVKRTIERVSSYKAQTEYWTKFALGDLNRVMAAETSVRAAALELRARLLVERSRYSEAADAAGKVAELKDATAPQLYGAACAFSMCAASIKASDDSKLSDEDTSRRTQYVQAAVAVLKRATAAGWNDYDRIRSDARLSAVRKEPEFQALLETGSIGTAKK